MGLSKFWKEAINKCYRGTIEDKLAVLSNYRFALCFENAIFSGYVTEKIFDALLAGCVPVYYGAPDIKDFVPSNCFVDRKKFKNYQELHEYLLEVDENKYHEYLTNIKNYLDSDDYKKFTQEYYAKQFLEILEEALIESPSLNHPHLQKQLTRPSLLFELVEN